MKVKHLPVTRRMIRIKAKEMYDVINPGSDFSSSSVWLHRFMKRKRMKHNCCLERCYTLYRIAGKFCYVYNTAY